MRFHRCLLALSLVALGISVTYSQNEKPKEKTPALVEVPTLPEPLREALKSSQWEEALKLLAEHRATADVANPDYLDFLKGRILADAGNVPDSLAALAEFEQKHPESSWLSRSRFTRAMVLARQRNFQGAAEIFSGEAKRLVSVGRREELVKVLEEFADRFYDGIQVEGPTKEKKPDYAQALVYYEESLKLRPGVAKSQQIRFRIGRCQHELGQLDQAIASYDQFLASYAGSKIIEANRAPVDLEIETRFQLGRALLATSRFDRARQIWKDLLASDLVKDSKNVRLAEAAFELAHTYGIPNPTDDRALELGVGAAQQFLKNHPAHALAPQAEFEIGQSYVNRGRMGAAVSALKRLIENAAYKDAMQIPRARQLLGQAYLTQGLYLEAIAAWKEFLEKHPTDPAWSQVQQSVIDSEFQQAYVLANQQKIAEARKLWETFLNKYPLDGRVPQILFQFGHMLQRQAELAEENSKKPGGTTLDPKAMKELWEGAIADYERLVSKFPNSNEASFAGLEIGIILEQHLLRLNDALEAYKKVQGPYAGEAQARIAQMTSKSLVIRTERKFRTDEPASIKVSVRNIDKVQVKVYRIDLADYFRKMQLATGVEALDIALIDPDKNFEETIPAYEQYRLLDHEVKIPVEGPGVSAVTVSGGDLESTTMLLISDIDVLVKSSRNELFIFAQNLRTGKPVPGASILISDGGKIFAEEVTGDDGILKKSYKELEQTTDLRVFAISEGHSASSLSSLDGLSFAVGLSPKGFLYTDRPVYRHGQLVHVRGIVRWVDKSQGQDRYVFKEGEKFRLDVLDSRQRQIYSQAVVLGKFGSFMTNFPLPDAAAIGSYRVRLYQPNTALSFEQEFRVEDYKLEPIQIVVDIPKKVVFRGESLTGKIKLQHYTGAPLAGRPMIYGLQGQEVFSGTTDAQGEIAFSLGTQQFGEVAGLPFIVQFPERGLATAVPISIATRGFEIAVSTLRSVYLAGDTFDATIKVADPLGNPVNADLNLEVIEQVQVLGQTGEKVVQTIPLKSGEKGEVRHSLSFETGGSYILRVSANDQFGNQVSGGTPLSISGQDDNVRLRIFAEQQHYRVGDQVGVSIHWRDKPALALVTFEGASILGYRLVELQTGANRFEFPAGTELAPNFHLAAAIMSSSRLHEARSEFRVASKMLVTLKTDLEKAKPGDTITVTLTATDPQGKPQSAEFSLGMVQQSVFDMFGKEPISLDEFFSAGERTISIRASSSCTFSYTPATRGVAQVLLVEEERKKFEMVNGEALSQFSDSINIAGPPGASTGGFGAADMPAPSMKEVSESAGEDFKSEEKSKGAKNGDYAGRQLRFSAAERDANKDYYFNTNGYDTNRFEEGGTTRHKLNVLWEDGRQEYAFGVGVVPQEASGLQRILPPGLVSETGYWNPVIVTNEQGIATIKLTMPEQSTAWRLLARGVNAETLSGQAETNIISKKDLFAELKSPANFAKGDSAELLVEVHNTSIPEKSLISVILSIKQGEKQTEFTKTIESTGPGISEVQFPIEITSDENATITVDVKSGDLSDTLVTSIPVRAQGIPVYATTGGTSNQSTTVFLAHDETLKPENPTLEIIIGPSLNRTLMDAVLSNGIGRLENSWALGHNGADRTVSDILGGISVLKMLGHPRNIPTPETKELVARVESGIARLVSSQNENGSWSWIRNDENRGDRYASSRNMWALSLARASFFIVPQETMNRGTAYLQSALAAAANDDESRAIIFHALCEAGAGDFAEANRLNRNRQRLSTSGLLHLALSFVKLDRKSFASELEAMLEKQMAELPKLPIDPATKGCPPWIQNGVELRALYLILLNQLEPGSPKAGRIAEWLMQTRTGSRFTPEKATGPALIALCDWYGRSSRVNEKYELVLLVNDHEVQKMNIDPSNAPSSIVKVPAQLLQAGTQRITFNMTGRGTFSYSAILEGFVPSERVKSTSDRNHVTRYYEPAPRMINGRPVPRGFDIVEGNYKYFRNGLTQLQLGEVGEVSLHVNRAHRPAEEPYEYLVLTESIPAGTVVVPGSVTGNFDHYELSEGTITFYIGDRYPVGVLRYDVVGYIPGSYKTLPSVLRSFYDPGQIAVASAAPLKVLARGVQTADEYKFTPREQYEFGKALIAEGKMDEAFKYLDALFTDYKLRAEIHREVVQWLFEASLALKKTDQIVKYFEIIHERYGDTALPFEQIMDVAAAYGQIGEYERSYLVYRAIVEANFFRESQVGGFLNARGDFVRVVQLSDRLIREYPAEPYIATATFALAQELFGRSTDAASLDLFRKANLTKIDVMKSSHDLLEHFLTQWPNDPAADQVAFSQANVLLQLEQFDRVILNCEKSAERYAKSKLLDSYWFLIGYSHFAAGRPDQALEMCRKVAETKFKDPVTEQETNAANREQAIYIMGQVYHSLGKAAEAIAEYEKVRELFADATEAIDFFLKKAVSLPDVTTVKPGDKAEIKLTFRNIPEANLKVYRIDLLKFGLLQRDLSRLTAINLAGIRPYHEINLKLGDGKDYKDRNQQVEIPLKEEGAYLVVCRGENLYSSGLVLVSPLALELQEDATAGRVRVTVKDTVNDKYEHKVHVKVIGSMNPQFTSGDSDLRGIFVADGINGTSTVIAQAGPNRYAFHRGTTFLGAQPQPVQQNAVDPNQAPSEKREEQLLEGVKGQNSIFIEQQRGNWRNIIENQDRGVMPGKAF